MFSLCQKLFASLIPFVLISFAWAGILGMGLSMEMRGEQMSGCPFMAGQATLCQMSVTEHITQWQQAFLGVPKGNLLILLASLLAMTLIPFARLFHKIEDKAKFAEILVCQKTRAFKVFDPLLLAFSDGILNPKIYEPAHI